MRLILILMLLISFGFATNYHIGSGQTYTSIAGLNWRSLSAGDTVFIHPGTYKEMIWLSQSGTEGNPIVVQGVLDGSGNRPIIDGDDMVVPPSYDGHLSEYDLGGGVLAQAQGLIFVHWSTTEYGEDPEWIEIKNLQIQSATPELYTFTNTNDDVQAYPNGSSAIYIKTGNHILVENCILTDCGNGFDVQGVDAMVHDITVRGNWIYGNGRTDSRYDREHNIYTEASGVTFEYNLIGRLRSGAGGSALKDRSAGTVIRYNIIYSGARCLDLVEPENQAGSTDCSGPIVNDGMRAEPGYDSTFVYGNIFINGPSGTNLVSGNMFHFGGDNCPAVSRGGTLFFYNNTTYIDLDVGDNYYSRIFDLTSSRETLNLRNSVFYIAGSSNTYFVYSSSYSTTGTINWNGGNWITSGYGDVYTGDTAEAWNENTAPTEGANSGIFTNASGFDFTLPVGSPLIDAGVSLAAGVQALHPVTKEYVDSLTYQARADIDDIGALMYGNQGEEPDPPAANGNGQIIPGGQGTMHPGGQGKME